MKHFYQIAITLLVFISLSITMVIYFRYERDKEQLTNIQTAAALFAAKQFIEEDASGRKEIAINLEDAFWANAGNRFDQSEIVLMPKIKLGSIKRYPPIQTHIALDVIYNFPILPGITIPMVLSSGVDDIEDEAPPQQLKFDTEGVVSKFSMDQSFGKMRQLQSAGGQVLVASRGQKILDAGLGNDVFIYMPKSGDVIIKAASDSLNSRDILEIGCIYAQTQISHIEQDIDNGDRRNHMLIQFLANSDQSGLGPHCTQNDSITIQDQFDRKTINKIYFKDGTVVNFN